MKLYEFNPGSDKPLLHLAHANGFPHTTYLQSLEPLFPYFRVVALAPRPLWGDTPPAWLRHWSQMADDLIAGLDGLGAKGVVGMGHSLGGVLTLYAAVKRPDLLTKVILIDPTMLSPKLLWQIRLMKLFGLEARKWLVQGALRRKREWANFAEAYQYFRGRQLFKSWPDETVKAYAESMTSPKNGGGVELVYPPEWEARIYQTIPTDVWGYARALSQPTLVIRGETSNTFTADGAKAFHKAKPNVIFKVVPSAGHLVPQEKPEEIGRLMMEFLVAEGTAV